MIFIVKFPFTIPYNIGETTFLGADGEGYWDLSINELDEKRLEIKRSKGNIGVQVYVSLRYYKPKPTKPSEERRKKEKFKGSPKCCGINFEFDELITYLPLVDLQIVHPSCPYSKARYPRRGDVLKGTIDVYHPSCPRNSSNPHNGGTVQLADYTLDLLKSPDLSPDVILKCGDALIPVHKRILSAKIPFFAAIFKHQMRESRSENVDIEDINPDVLRATLRYVYTGRTDHITGLLAENVLIAADKYKLEVLKLICIDKLKKCTTVSNVAHMLVLGETYDDLKVHVKKYLKRFVNFMETEQNEDWKSLKRTRPDLVMGTLASIVNELPRVPIDPSTAIHIAEFIKKYSDQLKSKLPIQPTIIEGGLPHLIPSSSPSYNIS